MSKRSVSLIAFLLALASIPLNHLALVWISWPSWQWHKTFYGQNLFQPLVLAAIMVCMLSAILVCLPVREMLLAAFVRGLAAVLMIGLSKLLILLLYGV